MRWAACSIVLVACGGAAAPPAVTPTPEPMCVRIHPVALAIAPLELATPTTPKELRLPDAMVVEVIPTGKVRIWYTPAGCPDAHPSGFPDIDRFLDAHTSELQ